MGRDISPEEARDEQLAELTDKHYETLRAKLLACDGATILSIAGAVARDLTDDVLNQLVVVAAMDHAAAGAKLAARVNNALLIDAARIARREVEQLEQQRKASQDEARIDRAVMDRASE